ncbi:MAG: lipoate--protein ligase family protein [Prevotella sp.]|nr:lipoate--protein ligase family protein [Prevotella sp.]
MEEYVARAILPPLSPSGSFPQTGEQEDCFFMWQVAPSVIFGRNQVMQNEVNVDYCRQHGIEMYRRKSGGGCVYADEGNVMLSFVTKEENVGFAFNRFINMVLLAFRKMGIEGTCTSHNDVLLPPLSLSDSSPQAGQQWRKVCGTACYHVGDRSIVHSTLLYDTNMQHMVNSITPSVEKLQSKGIESVRQRITLLKDYITLSLDEMKNVIRQTLCNGELLLTQTDIAAIEEIEQEYLRNEFIQKM